MEALVKWWFIVWACIIGAIVAQSFDLFDKLWHADATKLGYVTLFLFVLVTGYVGVLINRVRQVPDLIGGDSAIVKAVNKNIPSCWFASEAMNALGMIGTVAGFIIMLSMAFHNNINPGDVNGIRQLITSTALGLSTAATATLVGLACSTITKLQLVILERLIDEKDPQ